MPPKLTFDLLVSEAEYVKTYGKGRVCRWLGCATRLSQYNPDPYCAVHAKLLPERPPTNLKMYFKPCAVCGEWKDGKAYHLGTEWDGLSAACKACAPPDQDERARLVRLLNRDRQIACKQCGQIFPATLDYFEWKADNRNLLRSTCRKCRNIMKRGGGR